MCHENEHILRVGAKFKGTNSSVLMPAPVNYLAVVPNAIATIQVAKLTKRPPRMGCSAPCWPKLD